MRAGPVKQILIAIGALARTRCWESARFPLVSFLFFEEPPGVFSPFSSRCFVLLNVCFESLAQSAKVQSPKPLVFIVVQHFTTKPIEPTVCSSNHPFKNRIMTSFGCIASVKDTIAFDGD